MQNGEKKIWIYVGIIVAIIVVLYLPKIYKAIFQSEPKNIPVEEIKNDEVRKISMEVVGKWKSLEDSRFVREFRSDGYCVDSYDGIEENKQVCGFFDGKNVPKTIIENPEENSVYLHIGGIGEQGLHFEVISLTKTKLELIYLGRGNYLSFEKITTNSYTPIKKPISKPVSKDEPVFCTMDAKICPDGSAVGRTGPNCEFAPCP